MLKLIRKYKKKVFDVIDNTSLNKTGKYIVLILSSFLLGVILSILLFLLTILVFITIYFASRLFKLDLYANLSTYFTFGNSVNLTILGSFIVTFISLILVIYEYYQRQKSSRNSISIIFKVKNEFNLPKIEFKCSSKVKKIHKDIEQILDYQANDLLDEKFSSQKKWLTNYLIRHTDDEGKYKNLINSSFLNKIYYLTHGNIQEIFKLEKNSKNEINVIFNLPVKFGYQDGNISYFYIPSRSRIYVLSLSNQFVRFYDMKYVYITVFSKYGSTDIKNLKIESSISFHNRNTIIGHEENFLNISGSNFYQIEILKLGDDIFTIPVHLSINEIYTTMINCEVSFMTKYSRGAKLKIDEIDYKSNSEIEYILR